MKIKKAYEKHRQHYVIGNQGFNSFEEKYKAVENLVKKLIIDHFDRN